MSDHRERLEALRDQLAQALADADANMLPQLSGQYRGTLDDLAKLDAKSPAAGIQDDLKELRRKRRHQQRISANK